MEEIEKKGSKVWKVLAIVFICLFVVETVVVVWLFNAGMDVINNEEECSHVCYIDKECYAQSYDQYSEMCYLYDSNENVINELRMGLK